jgi:hypothetical protein
MGRELGPSYGVDAGSDGMEPPGRDPVLDGLVAEPER